MISRFASTILDILLPKRCIGCNKEGQYICKNCETFLSEVENTQTGLVSAWEYEGLIKKAILNIKHDGHYDIINELVEKALEKIDLNLPEDAYITYVPMHKTKEKQQGFNSAELIAKKIGKITNRQVVPLLIKIKDNQTQVNLTLAERITNVKNVFEIIPLSQVKPSAVLLIDDFRTTGTTLNECIKVLKEAGVKNIYTFTLASQLRI